MDEKLQAMLYEILLTLKNIELRLINIADRLDVFQHDEQQKEEYL